MPLFLGAPKSKGRCSQSERLHSGRDPKELREEPGKQKPGSCRAQELARSRAQENARKKKKSKSRLGEVGPRSCRRVFAKRHHQPFDRRTGPEITESLADGVENEMLLKVGWILI